MEAERQSARTLNKGHGRVERRELTSTTMLKGHLDWAGMKQAEGGSEGHRRPQPGEKWSRFTNSGGSEKSDNELVTCPQNRQHRPSPTQKRLESPTPLHHTR